MLGLQRTGFREISEDNFLGVILEQSERPKVQSRPLGREQNCMSNLENELVCVIGGSGFLGSHVADALTAKGYRVRIFDIHDSKWRNPDQEMVVGSILDPEALGKAINGCRYVYNFGGLASLDEGLNDASAAAQLNVLGNINVLDASLRCKVERYVFASTVYVYSRAGGFYRCSKQAAEQFIDQYQEIHGLPFTILRYGSLYGPRCQDSNGLYKIVSRALSEGFVSYTGSPESMREYIHVRDAAEASVSVLSAEYANKHVVLTGQEPMKVDDLLKMLAEILGFSTDVRFLQEAAVGHYVRTPYAYVPRAGQKYLPPLHVDLGQGLLELVAYIAESEKAESNKSA